MILQLNGSLIEFEYKKILSVTFLLLFHIQISKSKEAAGASLGEGVGGGSMGSRSPNRQGEGGGVIVSYDHPNF